MSEPLEEVPDQRGTERRYAQILDLLDSSNILGDLNTALALNYIALNILEIYYGTEKARLGGHELADRWHNSKRLGRADEIIDDVMSKIMAGLED